MKRIPWTILTALLAGFGLGLVYSWVISPLRVIDADPVALRSDFKDSYRAVIAAAYAANGNLSRAQARLTLLNDPDPVEALNAQAQRMLASGDSFQQADQVAALALALQGNVVIAPPSQPTSDPVNVSGPTPTITFPPPPPDIPIVLTETQASGEIVETQPVQVVVTPRPTRTAIPTLAAPFVLNGQENICDNNLPDGLLQVIVLNSNRRQMPGIKIVISWEGGEEQFFTGLKPELGNGYADYIMAPNLLYNVQLAIGSDVAAELTAPTCQTPTGETFLGGIKLTFQQP